jgi:hypothetical protein
MSTDTFRALCAELADWIDNETLTGGHHPLVKRARAALAQPEQVGPTDEDIMDLMPQQMHEDLAAAARALAEQAGTDSRSATGVMRIMLNRHAVDLARAALAHWGNPIIYVVPCGDLAEPDAEPVEPTDEELFCLEDLRDAWNAQADAVNSWDELGMDEIIWFAQQQALARWGRQPAPDAPPP